MINQPPPFKGLNVVIPIIIPGKGRGFINHGSTLRAKSLTSTFLTFRLLGSPKGPGTQIIGYYNISGIWALKTYYLGPWALKVMASLVPCKPLVPQSQDNLKPGQRTLKLWPHMSYSLYSLKGVI